AGVLAADETPDDAGGNQRAGEVTQPLVQGFPVVEHEVVDEHAAHQRPVEDADEGVPYADNLGRQVRRHRSGSGGAGGRAYRRWPPAGVESLLALELGAGFRVEVDLHLLAILVEAVDLVAVALGDLEVLDLVALGLEAGLELVLIHPLLLRR